jgi:hypothetical protein
MLANAEGASLVFESDNHQMFPYAFKAKRGLPGGYYPLPGLSSDTRLYEELWRNAFGACGAGTPSSRGLGDALPVACFSRPASSGFKLYSARLRESRSASGLQARSRRNTVSSWVELGWVRTALQDELAASDPGLQERLRRRFDSLRAEVGRITDSATHVVAGLADQAAVEGPRRTAIVAATRAGRGFEIGRLPDQVRDAWKRLTRQQMAEVDAVLASFPPRVR